MRLLLYAAVAAAWTAFPFAARWLRNRGAREPGPDRSPVLIMGFA